ncbi:hypothetical protein Hanom_Chr11g00995791 [Helianthus anomalus]
MAVGGKGHGIEGNTQGMHTDNNGTIMFEWLKEGLPKQRMKLIENEVKQLI